MPKHLPTSFLFSLLIAFALFCGPAILSAQTDPPKQDSKPPKTEQKQDQDKKADQDKPPVKPDAKKADPKPKADPKKTTDPKKDDGKQDDGKKDGKQDSKQDDKKKDDAKQDDAKKDDGKKADTKKSPTRTRSSTWRKYNKENPNTLDLFKPVVSQTSQSTVAVLSGTRRIAYGSIVDSTGLILTKSSELKSPLRCKLPGNRVVDAKIFGIDPETDLALIKVEEQMLPFIRFDENIKTPAVGSWLASAGVSEKPISIGVISVAERKIPPPRGFMGVQLAEKPAEGGVPVDVVMPGLPADNAGVEKGDIILNVNGKETPTRIKLIEVVSDMPPGTKIKVHVLRNKEKVDLEIILGNREELNKEESQRANIQNTMSGTISTRRKDFPLAFRHDGVLSRSECGGPVVNLDGQVIGVNIARGGRVESLVLPNGIVNQVIAKLKTGNFSPAVVNKDKIEVVKQQLKAIKEIKNFDSKKQNLRSDYEREEAVEENLQKILDNVQKQIDEAKKAKELAQSKLKDLKKQHTESGKQKEQLQKKLERLTKGIN